MNVIRIAVLAFLYWSAGASLVAQPSTPRPGSVVLFQIGYGVNFLGDIEVELFDDDKPITVSNFLAYVRGEAYRNTLLHRCVPGFTLQGGQWTVGAPADFSLFNSVHRIPAGAPIPNEFQAGSIRSNLFGTLAMWKPPGGTNSATSQWFFNLGDNTDGTGSTNLNTADGGATVFGRVTAGTNLLNVFNARSLNQGVLDTSNAFYRTFCSPITILPDNVPGFPFDALPVAYTNSSGCPAFRDLFTVQIVILRSRDTTPPRVGVTSPQASEAVTGENVVVEGTASDNVAVDFVRIYWNSSGPFDATVSNRTWTATLTNVPPGTNTVVVEAVDTAGLRTQTTRTFFRSVRMPLSLDIVGAGFVTGATDGQELELRRGYKLVARPAAGNLFAAWTGDFPQDNPILHFLMDTNTTVTAVFGTNLFPYVKGTYNGLFFDQDLVDQQSSGLLTLTLGSLGSYTARLSMNGRSHRFRGTFFVDGRETNLVARPGTNALLLHLALDLTNGTDRLAGTITNNQVSFIDPDHGWSASLMADRAYFDGRERVPSEEGRYTLIVPTDAGSVAGPGGDGIGTLKVSRRGSVSFSGTLADGTKAAQKASLSKNGEWPLYEPLYKGKGALIGWIRFTNETASAFHGLANWFKQSQSRTKYYPAGFTNETIILGSRYTPPGRTNRVIALTDAVVGFTNGNLAVDFANQVRLEPNNKVVNLGSNKLSLLLTRSTGRFRGSVVPPGSTRSISYHGIVLQGQNRGAGFILGTNESGRVSLGP